jgi:hypothetical protein
MPIDITTFNEKFRNKLVWTQQKGWIRGLGAVKHLIWKGFLKADSGKIASVPSFYIYVSVDDSTKDVSAALYGNLKFKERPTQRDLTLVDSSKLGKSDVMSDEFLLGALNDKYGLEMADFAGGLRTGGFNYEFLRTFLMQESLVNMERKTITNVYLRKTEQPPPTSIVNYGVETVTLSMESGGTGGVHLKRPSNSLKEATADFYRTIRELKSAGCVEGKGIPEGATTATWDFELNMPRSMGDAIRKSLEAPSEEVGYQEPVESNLEQTSSGRNWFKAAQDYTPWMHGTGTLPDVGTLESKIGTPDVDMNQIKAYLSAGIVENAKKVVDGYNPSLLKNIAFIWNLSDQSAFGVYIPALDQAIKEERVKKVLRQKGYEIQDQGQPGGGFTAIHQQKPKDQIDREVQETYKQLDMMPGTNFGINVNKIVSESQQQAKSMVEGIKKAGIPLDPQGEQEIMNGVQTIHLAGTIVHEAVHAQGSTSEGPSEQAEMDITNHLLQVFTEQQRQKAVARAKNTPQQAPSVMENPTVQGKFDEYVKKMFPEFHASKGASIEPSWFRLASNVLGFDKSAQYGAQFMKTNPREEIGPAPWVGELWDAGVGAIEVMLGKFRRATPFSNNNSLEKQMREREKQRWGTKVDANESEEELLGKDREPLVAYKSTETLLEDKRTKPLMMPVKAATEGTVKTAYFMEGDESEFNFGALSNVMTPLGGVDHPISERVLTGPRADADLFCDWEQIRKLPRYNPEYQDNFGSNKGPYYVWKDWALEPQTWDDIMEQKNRFMQRSLVASAKPEGEKRMPISKMDTIALVHVLLAAHDKIEMGGIKGTRFFCTNHVAPRLEEFFENDKDMRVDIFNGGGDGLAYVWVVNSSIGREYVEKAEAWASGKSKAIGDHNVFDYIVGLASFRKEVITALIDLVTEVCRQYGVTDVYVVGGFPRSLAMKESWDSIHDLDFSGSWPSQCLKIGGAVAEQIGITDVEIFHRTMTMSWQHMGIKCDFRGDAAPIDVRDLMRKEGIKTTPLNLDVYSRDFTINMFVYSLADRKVYDVTKLGEQSIKDKIIRTFFDPNTIVQKCPLIILRAIKYAVRYGFRIKDDLSDAMKRHSDLVFDGRYSDERLSKALSELLSEGKEKAVGLIEEYNVGRLLSLGGDDNASSDKTD